MLYSDIYSSVSLNPGMSPRFKVLRGIRQGCPISPKLFILTTQVLTTLIIKNHKILGITLFDKEFKISQFADDTSIFLKNKSMVKETLNPLRPTGPYTIPKITLCSKRHNFSAVSARDMPCFSSSTTKTALNNSIQFFIERRLLISVK